MKATITDTKTFSDAGALYECLDEIIDERNDGRDLAVWANGALLSKVKLMLDPLTGNEWIELI